jgi:hypothetical protein
MTHVMGGTDLIDRGSTHCFLTLVPAVPGAFPTEQGWLAGFHAGGRLSIVNLVLVILCGSHNWAPGPRLCAWRPTTPSTAIRESA